LSKHLGHLASFRVGELNGNYKGYKDEKRKVKARLKTWATEVKRRDKCCQTCNDTTFLSAHHIKPFSSHPELRFEITNGILLCGKCHAEQHENDKVKVTQLILNKYANSTI
jgi:5-methylcytosine-specific restriction endonuclease McrA